jgi:hypothetical protein
MGPNHINDKGFIADTALTQFRAVKFGTLTDHCTAVTAAGELAIGVAQYEVPAADAGKMQVGVRSMGWTKMEAGAAIVAPARVRVDSVGRAVPLAAATINQEQIGIAWTSAAGTGEWIDVFLTHGIQADT